MSDILEYHKCDTCQAKIFNYICIGNYKLCMLCAFIPKCVFCRIDLDRDDPATQCCSDCWSKKFIVSCILPGKLYLSDWRGSCNYKLLKKHGIKQILTIAAELPAHQTRDFETLFISLADTPATDITTWFDAAHKFIDAAPTLVHCAAGVSRSATLVISYIMQRKKLELRDALEYCRSIRPIIEPNRGFLAQLKKYNDKLNGTEDDSTRYSF